MAYENNKTEVLSTIEKNSRGDKIVVSKITGETSGKVSIDIRLYYTDDNDELQPTKKGVRFSEESTVDVIKALLKTVDDDTKSEILG